MARLSFQLSKDAACPECVILASGFREVFKNSCLYSFRGCQVINSDLKVKGKVEFHHPALCCSCNGLDHKTLCSNLQRGNHTSLGLLSGQRHFFSYSVPWALLHPSLVGNALFEPLKLWSPLKPLSQQKRQRAFVLQQGAVPVLCSFLMRASPGALVSLLHRGGLRE